MVQLDDSFVVHRKLPQTLHSDGFGAADPYKFTDRDVYRGLTAIKGLEAIAGKQLLAYRHRQEIGCGRRTVSELVHLHLVHHFFNRDSHDCGRR